MRLKVPYTADQQVSAAPLATVRIYFGLLMLLSLIRFAGNGWIEKLYLEPRWHFSYFGMDWLRPLDEYTYLLFALAGLASLGLILGWRYRWSVGIFFLSFTYIELMDKTTYLNHYYFISVLSFVMLLLPMHKRLSLDARRRSWNGQVPRWSIDALKLLLGMVYFYAGLAKLNSDWLLQAQPLATWLPGRSDIPLLGPWLMYEETAYFFSWAGAAFDLSAPFILSWRRTRPLGFILVVIFHLLTALLFPIGMFPYIMIGAATIFFSASWHEGIQCFLGGVPRTASCGLVARAGNTAKSTFGLWPTAKIAKTLVLAVLLLQLMLPWRYWLFPGELFWHERGFRFSWRVMLMEKAGYAQFTAVNKQTGAKEVIHNEAFLSPLQEKQMSFQPDFMLQYAHKLEDHYQKTREWEDVEIYVESYVALNGRPSAPYMRPDQDLTAGDFSTKWLMPFNDTIYGL